MIKRLWLALAGLFAFVSLAQAAGTVPGFSLTPQFDLTGHVAPGCRLYVIQAGTTSTPQNSYQDTGLTQLHPNPILCDAGARIPQFFVADGLIKLRLTDKNGVQIFVGDSLLVVGPSGGGGGGGVIDPTTIAATGDIKSSYGTSILSGWVRANGRTIGSSTSGATERANADCQALFQYLWGADVNLAVSGGRGASAAADWASNKTITLPDWRGRAIAGLDDMGNSAASRLTSTYFGTAATVLGAAGGAQTQALITANLPPYTPTGSVTVTSTVSNIQLYTGAYFGGNQAGAGGGIAFNSAPPTPTSVTSTGSITGVAQGGASTPISIIQPTMLATIYLKL